MNSTNLFQMALGLSSPWYVKDISFNTTGNDEKQLDIHIDFGRGAKFTDSTGVVCSVHDTAQREWQHLDFFQYRCILHARVPRIRTSSGEVKQIDVPWARPGSGFTLLFEAFAMCLIENEMPVNKAAATLSVYPNRLWTVFNYWVKRALAKDDQSILQEVGIDMSPAFIAGIMKNFPDSSIVFDRFHIVKLLNEAMDEVRKAERRQHNALKGHKYTFIKKNKNLSEQQRIAKYELIEDDPILGEAYRLKELFNDFWDFKDPEEATAFLAYWCDLVDEANLKHFKKFANMIKAHWTGILNYINSNISNGILEGINNKIQLAKRRARGYRNIDNFITMIYFIAGKLEFDYPHRST